MGQLLVNRGLSDTSAADNFLLGGHETLHDGDRLEGMRAAAHIVSVAVQRGHRILVHGDYDADGVSGTALLVAFLRDIGAQADPYIPHRVDEGYGLSAEGVRWAAEEGFQLMISVDCGSSSPHVVEHARGLGMKVVITDHHMVATPPPADAFVNPQAPGSTYPFPHLSGSGVAYKLVQAVARRLGCGAPEAYLDLAAIGTVGDVVPLLGENRVIVREGLAVIERLERPGIAALIRVAGIGVQSDEERSIRARRPITARDVAFGIAPRINACGRLEHAMKAASLLLEQDETRAEDLAREVDELNRLRRQMEATVRAEAEALILARGIEGAHAIVEASPDWHQGIVGITASRLLEKYGLPSFVISVGADATAKGSARAPAHLDLYACLTRCADLFTNYGGHPRAAGFSLPAANIDTLRERLQTLVPELSAPAEPLLRVDLELPLSRANLDIAQDLDVLAPFGQANPVPLFLARGITVRVPEVVGQRHWRFHAVDGQVSARCIAFNLVEQWAELRDGETFDMLYEIELDNWRGETRLNLVVRELIPNPGACARPAAAPVTGRREPTWRIVDVRRVENRGRYLADVVAEGRTTFVLCRRNQTAFVQRVVAAGAPQAPANLCAVGYGSALEQNSADAHWVLFTPPPSLAALAPLRAVAGGHCHVLFGAAEMEQEAALINAINMTRKRIEDIYRIFKKGANAAGIFDETGYAAMLERGRQTDLRVDSLRVGARILCEIGVLEASESYRGRYRFTAARADLSRSLTFQQYAGLSDSFREVREMFDKTDGDMEERLLESLT